MSKHLDFAQGKLTFKLGDRVTKIKGSSWTGRVVGFYSTALTREGYNVESENEIGSVQLYPVAALEQKS
jgi:dihydrofolate reductase (trimethoprim resistance protein)